MRRNILGLLLAELVLGQNSDVDLDVRVVLLKLGNQLLQVFHLRVPDRRNRDRSRTSPTSAARPASCSDESRDQQRDRQNALGSDQRTPW
jgi:hypothetical protein